LYMNAIIFGKLAQTFSENGENYWQMTSI